MLTEFCSVSLVYTGNITTKDKSSLASCGYAYFIMLLLCCSHVWLEHQHGVFYIFTYSYVTSVNHTLGCLSIILIFA